MNWIKKSRSAMITVELAVSLVLIVVVLFVALGMFGDNVKTMVTSSNFNNLMENNSQRTFFSNFKRDYKDAQVQVQVMGEQGLEMLRQKANNNALTVIDKILSTNNPPKDAKTTDVDTVAYLGLVITAIVGDSSICAKMEKPSKEKCNAIGLPVKYPLNLKDTTNIKIGQYTFKGSDVSIAGMTLTGKDKLEQTYVVISTLTNSYTGLIDGKLSLFNVSETFSTGLAASSSFERKLLAFLADNPNTVPVQAASEYSSQSLIDSLQEAKTYCNGLRDFWSWLGGVSNQTFGTDYSTPCAGGGVTQQDINLVKTIMTDPLVISQITDYAKKAESIAKTGVPDTTNTTNDYNPTPSTGGGGGGSECGNVDRKGSSSCNQSNYQSNLKIEKSIYKPKSRAPFNAFDNNNGLVMGYHELDNTSNMVAILQHYEMCSHDSTYDAEQRAPLTCSGGGGSSSSSTTTSSTDSSTIQCYSKVDDGATDCLLEDDLIYRPKDTSDYNGEPVYAVTMDSEKYLIKKEVLDDPFTTGDGRLTGTVSSSLRAAITAYYAKMMDTIWSQNARVLPILKKDQVTQLKDKQRETSCKFYLNTLSKISDTLGLVEYRDNFNYYYNSTMCNPDIAIVEIKDEVNKKPDIHVDPRTDNLQKSIE